MSMEIILGIYVFILAIFVGFEVIARVPSVLHTPLMSATNAIHGIVVLGAMLVAGAADSLLLQILGFIAATVSPETSRGARFPGTSAVVITTSARRARSWMSSFSRRMCSSASSLAYPPESCAS